MGLSDALKGRRVYFDTNIFIYLLEGPREFEAQISELAAGMEDRLFDALASDLVLTELLPPLVARNDEAGIRKIHSLLDDSGAFAKIRCSQDVFIQAGYLRGRFGMKTPDALHVAMAIEGRCGVFLTNDKGVKCPEGLQCLRVSEL